MFNKQDYYTEEDAIFANVEADLSYDGADGLCRAIIESYENERLVEAYMDKADAKESQMLAESASQEDIEAMQEASVGSVIQIIIGIMQRFYAKVKGMIARFIHKLQLWFAKRKQKQFKKDEKAASKLAQGKNKAGFAIGIDATAKSAIKGDTEITVLANKQGSDQTTALLPKVLSSGLSKYSVTFLTSFIDDDDKYGFANFRGGNSPRNVAASGDDKADIYDAFAKALFGKSVSFDDLRNDLKDEFFEEDFELTNRDQVVKFLENGKDIIKDLKNIDKNCAKICKDIAKLGKSAKFKDNPMYIKGLNRLVNIMNTCIFRAMNAVFSLTMEQLNSYYKAYSKITVGSVAVNRVK